MSFQEVINFVGGEVGRMERASVQAILPILDAAQRELTNDLAQWLATVPGGDAKFTAQRYRQALAQIKHTMAEIRAMEPALYQALLGNSFSAGQLATAHLQHEIQRFSLMYEGEARPTSLNAALIIARGNKELIPQFRSSAHRYAGGVGADIRAQLAIGVVRGETMDQLVNRLVRLGGPKGPVATRGVAGELGSVVENISEGLFTRYRHWAERLARTEVINAYNEHANVGLRDLAEDDPEMEKRWDASLDSRLCKVCQGLHGQTVPVKDKAGADVAFPGGYLRPPAHPCCRCAVVAWHADWGGKEDHGVRKHPDGSAEADFTLPAAKKPATKKPPKEKAAEPELVKPKVFAPPMATQLEQEHLALTGQDHTFTGTREGKLRELRQTEVDYVALDKALAKKKPSTQDQALIRQEFNKMAAQMGARMSLPDLVKQEGQTYAVKRQSGSLAYHKFSGEIVMSPESHGYMKAFVKERAKGTDHAQEIIRVKAEKITLKNQIDALETRKLTAMMQLDAPLAAKLETEQAVAMSKLFPLNKRLVDLEVQVEGMATMVHETFHAHSPMYSAAYKGGGVVVEEITTELAARRTMREKFGITGDHSGAVGMPAKKDTPGAYNWFIRDSIDATNATLRLAGIRATDEEIFDVLTKASLDYKADHRVIHYYADNLAGFYADKIMDQFPGIPEADRPLLQKEFVQRFTAISQGK